MAGAWMWVRSEARHRLRSLAALAVIVTVATAVVLAAIAGARRNGTAMDRLVARSEAATVMALPNTPGFDWNEIRKLPYVETVGEFALARYQVVGLPDGFGMFPSASPELFTEVERGIILDGRRPDPARADEALITPGAKRLGLHVGVHVRIALWRAGTVVRAASASSAPPPPDGPVVDVTVVGEMKTPFGIADDSGTVIVSHPFWERFRANVMPLIGVPVDNALIRLRGGDADVPALTQQLDRVAKHAVEVTVFSQERKRITNATSLERAALYGFALAAALAALVLIGQAVVRLVAASGVDVATLRALGTTRLLGAFALSVAPIVAGSVGVVAGAIGAYVASGRFPIGVGRRVEPQPGLHVDWAVLAPGIVIGLALLVAGVGGSAVWYVWRGERERSRRASLVATSVRNAGAPLPVALGTRLALERGHGRSGVPVRPALVGAVVGVLGIVGAMTFRAGLERATTDRALYGQQFDAATAFPAGQVDRRQVQTVVDDPDVAVVNDTPIAVESVDGRDLTVFGLHPLKGEVHVVTTHGRAPSAPDEIVLAPKERAALRVQVGDTVAIGSAGLRYRVVGIGFTPTSSHTEYDQGAWMTTEGLRRVTPESALKYHAFAIAFRPGVETHSAVDRLGARLDGNISASDLPVDLRNLKGVRNVPVALGLFLVVLAIAAIGHALASVVRRRRRDIAVLRSLGMTRRQARAVVAAQATTLALVGLVLGIPLGLFLGRTIWRSVADATPFKYVPPVAVLALVLVVPLAILITNALAAWPARSAARLRAAEVLRTE